MNTARRASTIFSVWLMPTTCAVLLSVVLNSSIALGQGFYTIPDSPSGSSPMGQAETASLSAESQPARTAPVATTPATIAGFPTLQPAPTNAESTPDSKSMLAGPLISTISSLAVVLGLFAGLVWLSRRYGGNRNALPLATSSAVEHLSSTQVDPNTKVLLLKCGGKILVVGQTPSGVQPISEITDPAEVAKLIETCSGKKPTESPSPRSTPSRVSVVY